MKKLIINDYLVVSALIKFAHKNKERIEVTRMGNDYVGVYWIVKYGPESTDGTRKPKRNGREAVTGRSRRKLKR